MCAEEVKVLAFDKAGLLAAGLTSEAIGNLTRRRGGGTSGGLGYEYQRWYALLRVIQLATSQPDASVHMEGLCPVDDVIVENAPGYEFSQCKTSKDTTWSGANNKLKKEFLAQRSVNSKFGITSYRLLLVVPDKRSASRLTAKLPVKLAKCARVVLFPLAAPIHHHWTVPDCQSALDQLLPPLIRGASQREQLYRNISAAANSPWHTVTGRQLIGKVLEMNRELPVVVQANACGSWTVTMDLWNQALSCLGKIAGLKVDVTGDICCYALPPTDTGFVARCDSTRFRSFVASVITNQPRTMQEFMEVLPI